MSGRSVLDEAIAGSGRVGDLHHELESLQHAMADPGTTPTRWTRYSLVSAKYRRNTTTSAVTRSRVRRGKCSTGSASTTNVSIVMSDALSGGWKMRVAMARVLLGRPDVLLMDEPTNHLDIESIVWFETFLKSLSGVLLMTSHDREFMNRIVSKIAEIDSGEITVYSGNYDFYEREREIRETNREAAYARQQAMLGQGTAFH